MHASLASQKREEKIGGKKKKRALNYGNNVMHMSLFAICATRKL